MTEIPDWLGPATDRLREVGLDEAADALARLPTVEERLERAIEMLELVVRENPQGYHWERDGRHHRVVHVIAGHRGETPEATLRRLDRIAR